MKLTGKLSSNSNNSKAKIVWTKQPSNLNLVQMIVELQYWKIQISKSFLEGIFRMIPLLIKESSIKISNVTNSNILEDWILHQVKLLPSLLIILWKSVNLYFLKMYLILRFVWQPFRKKFPWYLLSLKGVQLYVKKNQLIIGEAHNFS